MKIAKENGDGCVMRMSTPGAPDLQTSAGFPPVKKREIFGWCCFDFANSAFTTVIITAVYSLYFCNVVAEGESRATGWWGTALSVSQLIVIFFSPLVGAIGDVTARKKRLLMWGAWICSAATAALALVGVGEIWFALGLVVLANIAFSTSENICGAFLPELSTPETAGRISGYGWSFGYFGGLLSLVLAKLIMGDDMALAPRVFLATGAFFFMASLPTLLLMKERAHPKPLAKGDSFLKVAFGQINELIHHLPRHRTFAIFMLAMTVFLSGVTAIIAFAALFATKEIGMSQAAVIKLFIVLQLTGVAGAFGFGFLQDRCGAKPALILALLLWVVACLWASVCHSVPVFYVVGSLAGVAMGAVQSAARAVVSILTPEGRQGEFFGYWGFFAKLAAVIGPLIFGWIATPLGYRTAIVINAMFFVVGLLILWPLSLDGCKTNCLTRS